MDSKLFLSACSRVMRDGETSEYLEDFNIIYNDVYGTKKILELLKKSDFPDSPRIQQEYEKLLGAVKIAVIIPEIVGKSVYSFRGKNNTEIIDLCGEMIFDFQCLNKLSLVTRVPVVICHTEGEYKLEIVNHFNKRMEVDDDEVSIILEGEKQGIGVDKIIKFFVVHVPLKINDVVVVLGNNKSINEYISDSFDFNINNEDLIENIIKMAGALNYGYLEKSDYISSIIEKFYKQEINKCKMTVNAITDDIVRSNFEKTETLKNIRIAEASRRKRLENQVKEITDVTREFRIHLENLIEKWEIDDYKFNFSGYESMLFEIYFNYIECKDWEHAGKWATKIMEVDSEAGRYAEEYIELCKNKRNKMTVMEKDEPTWYFTKFIIANENVKNISIEKAESYIDLLGNHISTGKEYFIKGVAATDGEKIDLLVRSMMLGYSNASEYLVELYQELMDKNIEKRLLSAVVPEICLNYKGKNSKTYIKMAASIGDIKAISKLADEYFDKYFSKLTQIRKTKGDNDSGEKKRKIGYMLITMCDYLIKEKYMTRHFKEIKGEILFCLRNDYVTAMNCLMQISTDKSNFCKAKMYEFGYGVTKDYMKAIDYYGKIKDKESYDVLKNIIRVKSKYAKSISRNYDDYDEDDDYTETYSVSHEEDDGCFVKGTAIYMGDGTIKNVEDIRIGDHVLVYDHYKGQIAVEEIIANAHFDECEDECPIIDLIFENEKKFEIAISHGFFDCTVNRYVCINYLNVSNFVGHSFIMIFEGKILKTALLKYAVNIRKTKYYAPVSKYHLNVVAEGFLTMLPNEFAMNIFDIDKNMKYDLSILKFYKTIEYEQVNNLVSKEEYESYPICYLNAIVSRKNVELNRFLIAINQYRNNRNLKAVNR